MNDKIPLGLSCFLSVFLFLCFFFFSLFLSLCQTVLIRYPTSYCYCVHSISLFLLAARYSYLLLEEIRQKKSFRDFKSFFFISLLFIVRLSVMCFCYQNLWKIIFQLLKGMKYSNVFNSLNCCYNGSSNHQHRIRIKQSKVNFNYLKRSLFTLIEVHY